MQRPIKFRAWNNYYKEMHNHESLLEKSETRPREEHHTKLYKHIKTETTCLFTEFFNSEKVQKRYDFMQFTGLHDKNGKEIYEGDIVDFIYSPDLLRQRFIGVIEFNEHNHSSVRVDNLSDKWGKGKFHIENAIRGEVIGNIHENPELQHQTLRTQKIFEEFRNFKFPKFSKADFLGVVEENHEEKRIGKYLYAHWQQSDGSKLEAFCYEKPTGYYSRYQLGFTDQKGKYKVLTSAGDENINQIFSKDNLAKHTEFLMLGGWGGKVIGATIYGKEKRIMDSVFIDGIPLDFEQQKRLFSGKSVRIGSAIHENKNCVLFAKIVKGEVKKTYRTPTLDKCSIQKTKRVQPKIKSIKP